MSLAHFSIYSLWDLDVFLLKLSFFAPSFIYALKLPEILIKHMSVIKFFQGDESQNLNTVLTLKKMLINVPASDFE